MAASAARIAIAALTLSAGGLIGLVINEGYRGEAYIPTRGDVPTIGFGTTQGVKLGDRIDPVTALMRKHREISTEYEAAVKRCVKVPMYQYEFDAMVDTTYNIGATAFCNSTMVRRLNAENYRGACDAILLWKMYTDRSTGRRYDCSTPEAKRICGGLWTRRQAAHKQCLGLT
jgi:lysozyme